MTATDRPSPTDDDYRRALFAKFDLIDQLMQGANSGALWPDMLAGSPMESDDAECDPFQLSHIVQNLLSTAIQHLHAVAGLVRRAGMLHNAPPFTLCRAAVETAATSFWLLAPVDQVSRLWRHVVVVRQDTFDYEQVSHLMQGSLAARNKDAGQLPDFTWRRKHTDRIIAQHGLTGLPNRFDIVKMLVDVDVEIASQNGAENDHFAEMYWRTASGFGHGRQWATLNALVREQAAVTSPGVATVRISNTESRVFWGTSCAYELIDRSLRLFYSACGHTLNGLDLGSLADRSPSAGAGADGSDPN